MLPFVLMAQLNSEKLSQGCHSLQYFRSSAEVSLAARSVSFRVNSNCGSAQIDFLSKRDCLYAARVGSSVGRSGLLCQEMAESPAFKPARQALYSWMMTGAASAAFVARASDTPPSGVLGV
jgi:hypothetical protein